MSDFAVQAMKFMVQSKMSSMMGGGNSGGLGGLMSLVRYEVPFSLASSICSPAIL